MEAGKRCDQRVVSVAYPRHTRKPEELLDFIESVEFTKRWDSLGLDCEDDAVSLQLCIMSHPEGYPEIEGTGGLRRHIHSFRDCGIDKNSIAAYYAYFPEFGVVYMVCLDELAVAVKFTTESISAFAEVIRRVKDGLENRGTLN